MAGQTLETRRLKDVLSGYGIKRSEVSTRMQPRTEYGTPRVVRAFVDLGHQATIVENAEAIAAAGFKVVIDSHTCGKLSVLSIETEGKGVVRTSYTFAHCDDCTWHAEMAREEEESAKRAAAMLAVDAVFASASVADQDWTADGMLSKRAHAMISAIENADTTMRERGLPAYNESGFDVAKHGQEWAGIVRTSYATLAADQGFGEELPTEPLTAPELPALSLPFEPSYVPNRDGGTDIRNGNGELVGWTRDTASGMYVATVESGDLGTFPTDAEAVHAVLTHFGTPVQEETQESAESGVTDCACCGMPHMSANIRKPSYCDPCGDEDCDGTNGAAWHCETGQCDGTGCDENGHDQEEENKRDGWLTDDELALSVPWPLQANDQATVAVVSLTATGRCSWPSGIHKYVKGTCTRCGHVENGHDQEEENDAMSNAADKITDWERALIGDANVTGHDVPEARVYAITDLDGNTLSYVIADTIDQARGLAPYQGYAAGTFAVRLDGTQTVADVEPILAERAREMRASGLREESASDQEQENKVMTFDEWYDNTDFDAIAIYHGDDRQVKRNNARIRELYAETIKLNTGAFPVREGHRVIFATNANVGPCGHKDANGDYCRRPLASVMYHNGSENGGRYSKTVHADDGTTHSEWTDCRLIPACPKCGTEDSLRTEMLPYGNLTTCTADGCVYESYYDIGD